MYSLRRLSLQSISQAAEKGPLYSKTLLLPRTSFTPKLPSAEERTRLLQKTGRDLYLWQRNRKDAADDFVLHDGPPYANGDLHLGHSLNKILKDIINRFELIHNDSRVNYVPGWDCHGLPIEKKAVGNDENLDALEIRRRCRDLAQSMIEKQKLQFSDFAIMTDLDDIYVTMSHDYEKAQLQIFLKLMRNGLLSRQLKPVWWGCENQTALAEAELSYNPNHESVSIYVMFPLENSELVSKLGGDVSLLIWTSTPWTIPANKAVCINRAISYTTLQDSVSGRKVLVANELADSVLKLDQNFVKTNDVVSGAELEGLLYTNASSKSDKKFPVLHGDHVTSSAGTGIVHNAPAHGMEDYLIGKKHGLTIASVVNGKGHYIQNHLPPGFHELSDKHIQSNKTIKRVIEILEESKMLFKGTHKYKHSYPYDWKSNAPVIQRATPQWFVNVDRIKQTALELLEDVTFVPESGRNRLSAFVKNRNEWCISRQRAWGVPLPIVYNKETNEPLEDVEVTKTIVERLGVLGTDQWFVPEENISRWLPDHINGSEYYKGKDTMDVWFDSGTSWSTLINLDGRASKKHLADVYIEGSDQHRGWFQSSLLNKIIASGDGETFQAVAPYKKIITHGFTLDKENDKMSKSKGNVIVPSEIVSGGKNTSIPTLGVDGLRLWVASSNYTQDVSVSSEVLRRVLENVKKLRVTFKFILGNLQNFDAPVEHELLSPLDKWALSRLYKLELSVIEAYQNHNYSKVVREINAHMSSELSAIYFDVCKDCLYTHAKDSLRRRGIQTVLLQTLKTYIGLLAPIQPLLAQEAWDALSDQHKPALTTSPFMASWTYFATPAKYHDSSIENEMQIIWAIRESLSRTFENLRLHGKFKNKLEATVSLYLSDDLAKVLRNHKEYLEDYFLVSSVNLSEKRDELPEGDIENRFFVELPDRNIIGVVRKSPACKCPRCWKYTARSQNEVCEKCADVISCK
ncbi:isoleucyl-tRNA synthetase [Metschnikowia bicuspidata var. bicuspidata NRRL YB-4993]|uniref:isoleucine--tRNA ligase n=1 Tax=Metschnikowia bicuspidata var. bicuspidata NRRL YB-4993 TaxID=869754 RepID=A0A1A0HHW7_9ASCO|nr:isoleucyl-tRNA synthetase [Metschnikowia bicuspidata var. bicuspidata NRRL YB-4993]OBA23596.1 isoleucyl-tRNA synthetase [Metschnikowia bicuspidata var. bicuspidata NRRL YB-4993]